MLRLLAALLFLAPAVGAQTFVQADSSDFGLVVRMEPPVSFQSLGLLDEFGELEGFALAARGADGQLKMIAHEVPRQPGVGGDVSASEWLRASVGCGTVCFNIWYANRTTGAVSPSIFTPIYEDEARGWVLTPSADGIQIVDPFDLTWVWNLTIPEASPLRMAAMNLYLDIEVLADNTLRLSAEGVPDVIQATLPSRVTIDETGHDRMAEFADRTFDCPVATGDLNPFGEIVYSLVFAPDGRFVSAEPLTQNPVLERAVAGYVADCRAEPLPADANQIDQAVRATFRFE